MEDEELLQVRGGDEARGGAGDGVKGGDDEVMGAVLTWSRLSAGPAVGSTQRQNTSPETAGCCLKLGEERERETVRHRLTQNPIISQCQMPFNTEV